MSSEAYDAQPLPGLLEKEQLEFPKTRYDFAYPRGATIWPLSKEAVYALQEPSHAKPSIQASA